MCDFTRYSRAAERADVRATTESELRLLRGRHATTTAERDHYVKECTRLRKLLGGTDAYAADDDVNVEGGGVLSQQKKVSALLQVGGASALCDVYSCSLPTARANFTIQYATSHTTAVGDGARRGDGGAARTRTREVGNASAVVTYICVLLLYCSLGNALLLSLPFVFSALCARKSHFRSIFNFTVTS
jgi:hypothetical protein